MFLCKSLCGSAACYCKHLRNPRAVALLRCPRLHEITFRRYRSKGGFIFRANHRLFYAHHYFARAN